MTHNARRKIRLWDISLAVPLISRLIEAPIQKCSRLAACASAVSCCTALILVAAAFSSVSVAAESLPLLTNIEQVLELSRKGEPIPPHPVDLETVVTLPGGNPPVLLWTQWGTNALLVSHTNQFPRRAGARVHVRGIAASESVVKVMVDQAQVEIVGEGPLPEPLRLPVTHLFNRQFFGRWIEQEGVLQKITRVGPVYSIHLAADDLPVATSLAALPGESSPERWLNHRVRVQGVCAAGIDAEGRVFGFELHVPGTDFITEVASNAAPARLTPATPIEPLNGSLIEALAAFQNPADPPHSPANATNMLPVLTNVQQVLALGLDARLHQHPVRIVGVVTYPVPNNSMVYVDDGTGGIQVIYNFTDNLTNRHAGQVVCVDGIAGAGPIKPWIAEARLKPLGTIALPAPRRLPIADLASGRWHGQWIEIEGVVRDLTRDTVLNLLVAGGEHHVEIVAPYSQRWFPPLDWVEARVSIRGLCEVPVDFSGRPTQARLLVNDTNAIRILLAGTTNAFSQAISPPAAYRGRVAPSEDRRKISGIVLFQTDSGRTFLRDASGPVQAEHLAPLIRRGTRTVGLARSTPVRLQPGDQIELLGAPAPAAFAPRFVDAEYRLLSHAEPPRPIRVNGAEASSGRVDSDLVTLRARVVGRENRRVDWVDNEVLLLDDNGLFFEALCENRSTNGIPPIPRNSVVEVTGICSVLSQAAGHLRSFRLLVRDPGEIRVLGLAAPWQSFQPGRILLVSAGLGALSLAWIWTLRQRVTRRTAQWAAANAQLEAAQKELLQALAQEKELNDLKSRFVSMVSHEFRTPLGIITSSAEILDAYLDRLSPEERRSNLQDITDATRHMSGMMEEVLLLGRVEAGKMICRPSPLDLTVFSQRLIDEMTSATNGRCPIQFTPVPGLPEASADESLLRHIFTNLLDNAIKYSAAGRLVEFGVEMRGNLALFTVRDRGIGIPSADARLLFQAFHRGHNVGDTPGTGLGMMIVKRCVELHGGKITFESKEGHGTTFLVALPLFSSSLADHHSIHTAEFIRATSGVTEQNRLP